MIFNVGGNGAVSAEGVKYGDSNVGQALGVLEDELTANDTRIYMDYQNGKYGYNTSPLRGADTFYPFSSGVEPVLLWTNPNHNMAFDDQYVYLDLSLYKAVMIEFKLHSSYDDVMYSYMLNPTNSGIGAVNGAVGVGRRANVDNSGVWFGVAYYGESQSNSYCVPYKIYGFTDDVMTPPI